MGKKVWQLIAQTVDSKTHVLETFPVILGSGASCDVQVNHPSVAAMHVQFNAAGRAIELHDLQSKHGTFIQGRPIKTRRVGRPGARGVALRVGDVDFVLAFGPLREAPPAADPMLAGDDGAAHWCYQLGDEQQGPCRADEILAAMEKGLLLPTEEVWRSDTDYRVRAIEARAVLRRECAVHEPPQPSPADESRATITCPYCWHAFPSEDLLYIAGHEDLAGDYVLGPHEAQRFLPSRFTPEGLALDARGIACPDVACPRCHLRLPHSLVRRSSIFISLVGAPASGKSYLLASSTWKLRTVFPRLFGLQFTDVDAMTNQWLHDYEETVFFRKSDQAFRAIAKTDELSPLVYRMVKLDDMTVTLPLPCMFQLTCKPEDAQAAGVEPIQHNLVLYDNAGEQFQAGHDSAAHPGTRHMLRAMGILFLFDPSMDPRFAGLIKFPRSSEKQSAQSPVRQDVLLIEMIDRIRKLLGLDIDSTFEQPIILVVSKADIFGDLFDLGHEPWLVRDGRAALDLAAIAKLSFHTRALLEIHAPEVVGAVESFGRRVVYMALSALGHQPAREGIRPSDVKPAWVEAPWLYLLSTLGLVPTVKTCALAEELTPAEIAEEGSFVRIVPDSGPPLKAPLAYSGYDIQDPVTGRLFHVPEVDGAVTL